MNETEFNQIPQKERMNTFLEGYAYYASIHAPNRSAEKQFKGGVPKFSVKLGLEGEELEKAKTMGLTVYKADDFIPYPHVEIKRDVKEGKSEEEVKPDAIDSRQNTIPSTILIGNGSKARVKFSRFYHGNKSSDERKEGGGVGTVLFKLQVLDLVPYEPTDNGFEYDEGGFTVDTAASSSETPWGSNEADSTTAAVDESLFDD